MQNQARDVNVDRGVVRASIVYHLSKLDCSGSIMMQRSELTFSSTWHGAGGYAHGVSKSIAQGYLLEDIANHNSSWSIEILRLKYKAKRQRLPLVDANSLRMWS